MFFRNSQPPDDAVVGAGPAGCATALALARAGRRVLLLDGNPAAASRLAGEWLHPSALDNLRQLGVELPDAFAGRGFVVHPGRAEEPVVLPYPDGRAGASVEHPALVAALREAAVAHELIDVARARLVELGPGRAIVRAGAFAWAVPARVIGADGRGSLVRRLAGLAGGRSVVSHMAGVVLDDAELPLEGFGHVVLGGPGPMLLYRLGADRIRVCLDVPARPPRSREAAAYLWAAYSPHMPEALVPAFRSALRDRGIVWAANHVRMRSRPEHFGGGDVVLVGDAAGHFHPLTAVGMTLAFADAVALAEASDLGAYARERAARSRVPELLAGALYEAFTRTDEGTAAVRRAMVALWRRSERERVRTMRLLAAEETRMAAFTASFLGVVRLAVEHAAADAVLRRRVRPTSRSLGGLGWWLRSLAAGRFEHQPG